MIEESWDKHYGQLCVGLNWEPFPSKEDAKVWRPLPNRRVSTFTKLLVLSVEPWCMYGGFSDMPAVL